MERFPSVEPASNPALEMTPAAEQSGSSGLGIRTNALMDHRS